MRKRNEHGWAVAAAVYGCLALALSGCAVRQAPKTQQAARDSLPAATKIPDQWTSAGADGAPVEAGWLKSFQDPRMDAIVAEAVANNRDLQAAVTQIEVANNIVTQAHSQLLPVIAFTGAASVMGRFNQKNALGQRKGHNDSSSALGGVSWEVDLWGRVRSQTAAAKESAASTRNTVLYARQSLAAMVAKVWYLATYTKMLEGFAGLNVRLNQQNLEVVKVQRAVGEVDDIQVDGAQAALNQAQYNLEQVRSSYQQTVRGLELLLGRYPSAELKVAEGLVSMPPPVPAGLPMQLLERRPDVMAAEQTFNAAFHLVQTAEAARLPALSLTGASGYLNNDVFDALRLRPSIWTVAANLVAPLYTGGYLKAQVKIANENQRAALMLYGQTILNAFGDVEINLTNERLLKEEQQQLDGMLAAAEDALRIAKVQYETGAIDLQPVLQAQGAVLGAKTGVTGVQLARLGTRINLHLALGGSF
jgi:outer membrane protein, multidrug efflux system